MVFSCDREDAWTLDGRLYIGSSGRAGASVTLAPAARPAGGLTMSWSESDKPWATCTLRPKSWVIWTFRISTVRSG